jgi:hypothetical protein
MFVFKHVLYHPGDDCHSLNITLLHLYSFTDICCYYHTYYLYIQDLRSGCGMTIMFDRVVDIEQITEVRSSYVSVGTDNHGLLNALDTPGCCVIQRAVALLSMLMWVLYVSRWVIILVEFTAGKAT